MGKRAAGGTFEVVEPLALARYVRRRINTYDSRISDGSPEACVVAARAAAIGMKRQTLDRIARGCSRRLRGENIYRLFALWDHEPPPEVVRSVYPVVVVQRYMQWVNDEIESAKGHDAAAAEALRHHLRATKLVPELEVIPKRMVGRFYAQRLELRIWRALSAVLPSSRGSEGIERHWKELSDPELRAIIRAGLKQQSILLQREPDSKRLAHAATASDVAQLVRMIAAPHRSRLSQMLGAWPSALD
jgi:hypothetical protein